MPEKPVPFANTDEFYIALGLFYAAWSRAELAIDCATWKASGTESAEQAHARSAGMRFSDKCKRLRTLLNEGKIPNSENAKDLLAQIESCGRNIFAHSFLASDEHSVTFIHRKVERGKYLLTGYTIPRDGFIDHVQDFVQLSFDFENAVGLTDKEVADFGAIPHRRWGRGRSRDRPARVRVLNSSQWGNEGYGGLHGELLGGYERNASLIRPRRKGGSLVPKKSRSGAILECYRRAAEARRMADGSTNRPAKADFLAIERRWLSLARSDEVETVRAAPRRAPRSPRKQRGRG
jgi:hypothetical protein